MAKHQHQPQPKTNNSCSKFVFIVTFACLVGLACIINLASSFSLYNTYLSFTSNWVSHKPPFVVVPKAGEEPNISYKTGDGVLKRKKGHTSDSKRVLSATFADLPAPDLPWEQMPSAPVPRLDGSSIQIGNLFYVISGYGSLDYVHSHVDVFNFSDNTWCARIEAPKYMANSHLGVASDGRFIYVVSGQYGPQCRGPTSVTYVLDTQTREWLDFPPLPAPRQVTLIPILVKYMIFHDTALSTLGFSVKDGKALEKDWQPMIQIPRGGPHRACVVANDRLFVIGGQEGDFMAKPGSPIFKCSRRNEVVYEDVYMLEGEMKEWKVLPPMPKPNSHIECSWVIVNNSIIITGGTTEKHPVNNRMILVGEVFQFHLDSLTWSVIGKLPYRAKTTLAAFWDGYLYFTSGQRDRGPDNPQPMKVVGEMWRAKINV
ncbi:hypothetical protein V6N12_045141 [Hibiscus sabdariffa]|uniref:Kelch repeat-containing protein n=1 Tax=Hibiscus sabdariffa TaxID=183260 RepID=A0ABR2G250_9ROSI